MLLAYTVGCAGVGLTIRVQNLHVSFPSKLPAWLGQKPVIGIRNETFTLSVSQPVAIVGDSGAGKSCFLKCATNRTKPTSGSIAFTDDQGAPVPSHTFYVDRDFMYSLASRRHTVLEIVSAIAAAAASAGHVSAADAAAAADATAAQQLRAWNLWDRRAVRASDLGSGDAFRLALAAACAAAPPRARATLLGLDELLDFADPRVRAAVEADVRRACAGGGGGGVAVMAVTHALDHAAALVRGGGAVLHWCGGEAIQIGPPEEVEYLRWKPQQAAQGRR